MSQIQNHIIAVTGGKGGVGKSVFTANLACAFLLEARQPVLLIDLDQKSCGDQNIITGLKPVKTIKELATFTGALNPQTLPSLITKHPSGLHYIGAVRSPEESLSIDSEILSRILDTFSKFYRYILIDLGNELHPTQFSVIEKSSLLICVTTPEVLAVNQTYRLMNELAAAAVPTDMVQIVVNKANNGGLPPQAIGQTLRRHVLEAIVQDDMTSSHALQRSTPFVLLQNKSPMSQSYHEIVRKLLSTGVLDKLKGSTKNISKAISTQSQPQKLSSVQNAPHKKTQKPEDPRNILKMRLHSELIKQMDLKKNITDTQGDPAKEAALRAKTQQVISEALDREQPQLSRQDRTQIIKEVLDEALGLGPLEDLLSDDSISEIMVNGKENIFVEKSGKVQKTPVTFTTNQQLKLIIERIVTPLGRRIDEKTPYVDARLKDGSRVHAIIEPLALDGPTLTIRKFAKKPITPQNYIEWNTISQSMLDFLKICVENGLNVIISGGTGSGKTTLLNVLSGYIPATERIITVEDAAELQLKQTHVVRLETRPANMEGTGAVTIRDLVRNTLRMRPDRIVVGECRGGEALDMLSAMNTGHDGSMTTVHANSPREAIGRLETLCMMAGMDLPARAIREQIAGAVDLIVQISRLSDGSRKVISITEVVGMQGDAVTLQEVFRFKEEGFDKNRKIVGQFQAMGLIPSFVEELRRKNVNVPNTLFSNQAPEIKKAGGQR